MLKLQLQKKLKGTQSTLEDQWKTSTGFERLVKSFKKVNAHPNNEIDFVEFKRGLEIFDVRATDVALKALFEEYDHKKQGKINILEFANQVDPLEGITLAKEKIQSFDEENPGVFGSSLRALAQNGTISKVSVGRVLRNLMIGLNDYQIRALIQDSEKIDGGLIKCEDFVTNCLCIKKGQQLYASEEIRHPQLATASPWSFQKHERAENLNFPALLSSGRPIPTSNSLGFGGGLRTLVRPVVIPNPCDLSRCLTPNRPGTSLKARAQKTVDKTMSTAAGKPVDRDPKISEVGFFTTWPAHNMSTLRKPISPEKSPMYGASRSINISADLGTGYSPAIVSQSQKNTQSPRKMRVQNLISSSDGKSRNMDVSSELRTGYIPYQECANISNKDLFQIQQNSRESPNFGCSRNIHISQDLRAGYTSMANIDM